MKRGRILLMVATCCAVAANVRAHEGHDHSGATLLSNAPPSLGAHVYLPKATQFLMEVRTAPVVAETLPQRIKTLGRIAFPQTRQAQVRPPFPGVIVPTQDVRLPEPGERVEAGTVLALLEQSIDAPQRVSLSAEIADAETELELAKEEVHHTSIELDRVESLGEAASQRRVIEARAANNHARLQVEGLQRKLEKLHAAQSATAANPQLVPLSAPISGVISAVEVTPGEYVGPERLLFEIVDPSVVWAVAHVYEQDLPILEDAKNAMVTSEGYAEAFEAVIHHISPRLDTETRTVEAVFDVANPDGKLRDGMFVTVHIETAEQSAGLMVPKESVIEQNGMNIAYVKTGAETFVPRQVRVAGAWGDRYMIEAGLLPDEVVVTQGIYQLRAAAASGGVPQPKEESSLEHGHEH